MKDWCWEEMDPRIRGRLKAKYPHAPDIVQETITRLFILLSRGAAIRETPEAYALGIAENVQRETWRQENRFNGIVADYAVVAEPAPVPEPSGPDLDELKRTVFTATERRIFEEYYQFGGDVTKRRERLARKLGISMNTLYQRVFRLKERLAVAYKERKAEAME